MKQDTAKQPAPEPKKPMVIILGIKIMSLF